MDRIKRALEKNKIRRQHVLLEQSEPEAKVTTIRPHDDIKYSQTKTIKISKSALTENRIVAGNQSDPRATYFRMLRTQVLQAMRENDWSSLAITGPLAGVGKSLVATNLAISISMEVNQTVLLVDLDLRRPALHKYFNFKPKLGLLDYLNGDAVLPDLLVNPGFKRLVLLPGRGSTSESSELLSSPRMLDLI